MLVSVVWDLLNQKESQNKKIICLKWIPKNIYMYMYTLQTVWPDSMQYFFFLNIFFFTIIALKSLLRNIFIFLSPSSFVDWSQISHLSMFIHFGWLNKIFRFLHSKSNHVVSKKDPSPPIGQMEPRSLSPAGLFRWWRDLKGDQAALSLGHALLPGRKQLFAKLLLLS